MQWEAKAMKALNLKISMIAALALGAASSANAAMPVAPIAGDPSIILVACAPGWYRGPGGACYIIGTGPRHYGGGGVYYGRPVNRGGYYGHPAYRGGHRYRGGYHGGYRRR
jgi:hypothetical protein